MELKVLDMFLIVLSVLSFVWSFFSEEYRLLALVLGFVFIIVAVMSVKNEKIEVMFEEQRKLGEKLKIHEQLIDIKKDIEILKEKGMKK